MHVLGLDPSVSKGIGLYFLLLGLANACWTWYLLSQRAKEKSDSGASLPPSSFILHPSSLFWAIVTASLLGVSLAYFVGHPIILSQGFRDFMDNEVMGPKSYFASAVIGFIILLFVLRKWFVTGIGGWIVLNLSLLFIGFSMTDKDFRAIVTKPDNVPISMLIYSVGFTTWLGLRQAARNDERLAAGKKPFEAEQSDHVLVWPDLVYTEMIAMVVCTVFLLVWSILLKAPLEPPASMTQIPNPSKAPWYFLGLQEMLVYFDPWLAGVVLPTYILIGLMAIPYIDYNKKGQGYFTFVERKFAITTFMFGFIVLWLTLIVLGTFLRGPNWNFFGFYEEWSPTKVESLNNVMLSDYLWINWLGTGLPTKEQYFGSAELAILVREFLGIVLLLAYFAVPPLILAKTLLRGMFMKMGMVRYMTMVHILLMMAFLPAKMILRWSFNLKYIVYIPEYFFNV